MRFLIDTNVCIRFLKGDNENISKNFALHSSGDIIICSVVRAELFYGVYRSKRIVENLRILTDFLSMFSDIPFNSDAAAKFGIIRADIQQKGTPIGPYDLQIAAIALVNNLTIVSHNTREFSRIPELMIDDWEL